MYGSTEVEKEVSEGPRGIDQYPKGMLENAIV
jgi:hypothetical protein